jgi:hypothetical protein
MGRHPEPRMPRRDPRIGPRPTMAELLDLLEAMADAAFDIVRRWDDGVQPELRAEVLTNIYEPAMRGLLRARRRPLPR